MRSCAHPPRMGGRPVSLLLGEQEGKDVSKGRSRQDVCGRRCHCHKSVADVVSGRQRQLRLGRGQRVTAQGWPGERDALVSLLISTAGDFSAPSCSVCVLGWRPWPAPWCAQPGLSLTAAAGPRQEMLCTSSAQAAPTWIHGRPSGQEALV